MNQKTKNFLFVTLIIIGVLFLIWGVNKVAPLDAETFDFKDMVLAIVLALNAKGILRFSASLLPFMRDWVDSLDELSALNTAEAVNNRRFIRGKGQRLEVTKKED